MKFVSGVLLALLSLAWILPAACTSNNANPAGPVTLVLQQSANFTNTPTPPPTNTPSPTATAAPVTFTIWQNGLEGCFQGNCLIGQVYGVGAGGPVTTFASGNNLEVDSTVSGNCDNVIELTVGGPIDATAFTNGHLQFDLKLGIAPSSFGSIYVSEAGPFVPTNLCPEYGLNLSLLSTSSFTHVSVPTNFFNLGVTSLNTWREPVFYLEMFCPNGSVYFPSSGPLLYLNNIEWTSN